MHYLYAICSSKQTEQTKKEISKIVLHSYYCILSLSLYPLFGNIKSECGVFVTGYNGNDI